MFHVTLLGCKPQKQVCLSEEDSSSGDDEDRVTCIEWDPLSVDYLLVATRRCSVRLIEINKLSVVMSFALPSAAAEIQSLAWIDSAPGMFVTGGNYSYTYYSALETRSLTNCGTRQNAPRSELSVDLN